MPKSRTIGAIIALALTAITAVSLAYAIQLKWSYENQRADPADKGNSIDDEVADWTFGLLITSIITVATTSGGLYWVARSLAATNRANDLSARSLEISERAWVFTTPSASGQKVTNGDGSWSISVVFENINNGRTVALEVRTSVDVAWYGNQLTKLNKLSESAREYADTGIMIFPRQKFNREWILTPDNDIPDDSQLLSAGIADMLVGVISYRIMFDDKIHQTAFVYAINVGDDDVVTFSPWAGGYAT